MWDYVIATCGCGFLPWRVQAVRILVAGPSCVAKAAVIMRYIIVIKDGVVMGCPTRFGKGEELPIVRYCW